MGYAGRTVALALGALEKSVRICHILQPGTGNSYCELTPYASNEHLAHDRHTCSSAGHQICAVCSFEYERLRAGGSDD